MRTFIAARNYWLLIALFFLILAGALLNIEAHALPFEPYRVVSYTPVPPRACPNTEVKIRARYDYHLPGYVKLDKRGIVRSFWINPNTQTMVDAGSGRLDLTNYPQGQNQTFISPILRKVPDTPGEWLLQTDVTVSGEVFRTRRIDPFTVRSKETLTVLEPTDPSCLP